MKNRTPLEKKLEAEQAQRAWFDLCALARTMPDWPHHTSAEVAEKARRRGGWAGTDEEAEAIWQAYRNRPHVCPAFTWHVFDRPCSEARRLKSDHHPGCCPRTCPYPPLKEE